METQISLRLPASLLSTIDRRAKRRGSSRSNMIRTMLEQSFDEGAVAEPPAPYGRSRDSKSAPDGEAATKVSVVVAARLMEEVDRIADAAGRSAIVEAALESWLRARRQVALDRGIEQYYRDLAATESAEDRAWAEAGDSTVAKSWNELGPRSE